MAKVLPFPAAMADPGFLEAVRAADLGELPRLVGLLAQAQAEAIARLAAGRLMHNPGMATPQQHVAVEQAAVAAMPDAAQGYLRQKEVLSMLGVSRETVWRWRRRGTFPEPVRLGPGVIAWSAEDLRVWRETVSRCVPRVSPGISAA